MVKIPVHAEIEYDVIVGDEWIPFLAKILNEHTKVMIIAPAIIAGNAELKKFCISNEDSGIFLFVTPDGEDQKNIAVVESVWQKLGEKEFGRTDAIIGIGGGATTDLAGFVAANWLRGIAWYAIPTTLAGMVDASVGGK